MTAPAYSTDLQPIALAESGETWGEPTGATGGGVPGAETDYLIQGSACFSKSMAIAGGGLGGMGTLAAMPKTITSPNAIFTWVFFSCTGVLDTEALGGMRIIAGHDLANYRAWYVRGNNTDINPYQWNCIPVDPNVAYQATQGTPSGVWQYFGAVAKTLATVSKGNPFGTDCIRFGRTLQCIYGLEADGYATFVGAAAKNDANNATDGYNRWGLFEAVAGGYKQQGLFLMGTAGVAVDFRDANRSIVIPNTLRVTSGFNAFEVRHASSRIDWTAISITALGTVSRGDFITTDNADINFENCVFTDMGVFGFLSASTILTSTFRRCGMVTTGGGTFIGCRFEASYATAAVRASNPSLVSGCVFTSAGTGHAIEATTAGDYTSNNTFSGYTASSGGNEAFFNNSGGHINLTITGGTEPSVRNSGGSTTTIILDPVTIEVTCLDLETQDPIQGVAVTVKANGAGPYPYNASVTITRSGNTATVAHAGHNLVTGNKVEISGADQNAYNRIKTITWIDANSYTFPVSGDPATPATGTITATAVFIDGDTDVSGEISNSRAFGLAQAVTGFAAKGSSSPLYKRAPLTGTVSTTAGLPITTLMTADE